MTSTGNDTAIHASELEEIFVLNKRVRLLHLRTGGFRTSLDSVMLAAGCPAMPGDAVLDLGCGVGGAGLSLLARVPGIRLTGVEILPLQVDLARRNAALNNHTAQQADFICADIRAYAAGLAKPGFNHVICNPPYLEAGTYTETPDAIRASALGHLDAEITIADWVRAAHRCVKSKGSVTFIYRADGLDRLLAAMGKKFGAVEIIPLWPKAGEAARRVIVRALKDRRGGLTLQPGIVLHEDGKYTREADAVLREAQPVG